MKIGPDHEEMSLQALTVHIMLQTTVFSQQTTQLGHTETKDLKVKGSTLTIFWISKAFHVFKTLFFLIFYSIFIFMAIK